MLCNRNRSCVRYTDILYISELPLPPLRESKRGIINERLVHHTRRRKMLQPKKTSHQQPVVARRRGRSRRNIRPPPSSDEESEDEEKRDKLEDGDEDPEELEKTDPDEIDELNVFKGNSKIRNVGSFGKLFLHANLYKCLQL
jgi:hypothetical protein